MSKKPKYKRFATILKEHGYDGEPILFLQQLLSQYPSVVEAAAGIGTTHATLYYQLALHNLIVQNKGLTVKGRQK